MTWVDRSVVFSTGARSYILTYTCVPGDVKNITEPLWFSLGTPVSSTNKTDRHDVTKILLKVVLSTITLTLYIVIAKSY